METRRDPLCSYVLSSHSGSCHSLAEFGARYFLGRRNDLQTTDQVHGRTDRHGSIISILDVIQIKKVKDDKI